MNKILKAILILITVFAVVNVTGCTLLDNLLGTPDPDPNPDHHHEFSSEWSMDEEYHWHAATCGHDDAVSKVLSFLIPCYGCPILFLRFQLMADRTTRKTFHPRLTKGVKNKPGNNLLMGPIITNKQTTNKAGVKRTGRKER